MLPSFANGDDFRTKEGCLYSYCLGFSTPLVVYGVIAILYYFLSCLIRNS